MEKYKIDPKKAFFKKSVEIGEGKIQGYNFEGDFDAKKFFDSFKDTGFQAANLGKAIELAKEMQKQKAFIFLGFTSNMSTCGVREAITYLVKNKLVNAVVTTTGGLEEDIIKTHGNFLHGDFNADGAKLRENGVNRSGNIFVPNERYIWYEKFARETLTRLYNESKKIGKTITSLDIIKALGKELEGKEKAGESFTYWAFKNNIPLYCIPINDGATGDHLYFFKKDHPDFAVDLVKEVEAMYDQVLVEEKIGAIIIGGSTPKHFIMNACIPREGADYTIYINTGYEGEGSNAGANPEEAKSWGKASPGQNTVKVWGEASIIFPILIAAAFKLEER
jgi:deoxyhypusine synthase